ncbi:MAG: hypothetical protein OEV62_04610 [Actinomycetota bacterium]|nr:hypothetical protein [Actinomycetota bacterium]
MTKDLALPTSRTSTLASTTLAAGLAGLLAAAVLPQAATAGSTGVVVRTMSDPRIVESSGLARSNFNTTRLWTHNDSGGGNIIYAIGRTGRTTATYRLANARSWDWEAMASARRNGVNYLFVGDIGDNRTWKDTIFVHRVREPKPSAPNGTLHPKSYEFRYPDGSHDAETLMVRPGSTRIYIVSKVRSASGHVYVAPKHPSVKRVNRLKRIATVPSGITDGVFLDRKRFVLRGYGSAWLYRSIGARPKQFSLPHSGESITRTWRRGSVFIGHEGRNSDIWRVPLP